jgi:hypothetical protein
MNRIGEVLAMMSKNLEIFWGGTIEERWSRHVLVQVKTLTPPPPPL